MTVDDLVHAEDDHDHAGQLLDQQGDIHRQAGEHFHPQLKATEGADGLLPLILAFAFGVVDLHRIQAGQGLDQARLTLGPQRHGPFHGRHQGFLQGIADGQGDRERQHRYPHKMPAKDRDDDKDQNRERQVNQAGQCQRGEEVPQALELMDVLGKAADPRRPVFHGHADDALEQRGRDNQVGFLAGQIQAQATQAFQDQVEQVGARDAECQHPERRFGLVRHDTVVDVHHEQRRGHGNDVDQKTGGDGVGVQPARTLEGVAEPRARTRNQRAVIDVEFVLRLGKKDFAGVIVGQQLAADHGLTAIAFAKQHPRLIFALPAKQDGTATVLEQQQCRHGNRRNILQLALQHPTLQPRASCRAR
ncbi:hypothetical protein D3C84_334890 [compost metagenome]